MAPRRTTIWTLTAFRIRLDSRGRQSCRVLQAPRSHPLRIISLVQRTKLRLCIVAYINSLDIGESVNIARVLASAVKTDAGIVDERFSVEAITLGRSATAQTASSLAIAWNEAVSCAPENVTVEVQT